ncbi:1-phosphofructokinase family hexose kinase [Novosphingobium sp.]|uniref:1-phosphofructokinase family hexose kinase n=1 Tax=Novosphingobium sp. TaxID=1874826 RepID=UPI0025D9B0F4|nr:hexose kinase [Novosphingobium sp.]
MDRVATLTLNPAIDSACEAEEVSATRKIRTHGERYDPGGGGLNVARVLHRFGIPVEAIYLSGGPTGALLDELLDKAGLPRRAIPIRDHTRMSLAVYERSTGHEYRFVPEGPLVAEDEWRALMGACFASPAEWVVASGSLPRGLPDDFWARLAAPLLAQDRKLVVDTSGAALAACFAAGSMYLAKPSVGEFETFLGRALRNPGEVAEAACALVAAGKAKMIAVTMGEDGAVLAHSGGVLVHSGIKAVAESTTGAGDSFVGGLVTGLILGEAIERAFLRAVAAGTAAVLHPGTDLCRIEDVDRLLLEIA